MLNCPESPGLKYRSSHKEKNQDLLKYLLRAKGIQNGTEEGSSKYQLQIHDQLQKLGL